MSNNDFVLPKLPVKDMHVSWYVSPKLNLFSNRNPNSSYPISGSGLHVLFLHTFHHFLSVWLASKVNLLHPSHKKWNLSFWKKNLTKNAILKKIDLTIFLIKWSDLICMPKLNAFCRLNLHSFMGRREYWLTKCKKSSSVKIPTKVSTSWEKTEWQRGRAWVSCGIGTTPSVSKRMTF
jgi:hypothetical protein